MTNLPVRKAAEHQEIHDEVQGMSTVLQTRKKDKKATSEAHAVQEQDNPLQTKSPAKIQDNEKMNNGAHTTAALSQGIQFVPSMEHIAPFISSFKKDFQNAPSEVVKKNLCWQVLAHSHDKSPLPFVNNGLKFIQENLEKKDESVSIIAKDGEMDVLFGQWKGKCVPYIDRTLEFKNLYLSANSWREKNEVVSAIYIMLKKEGFRFLEKNKKKG